MTMIIITSGLLGLLLLVGCNSLHAAGQAVSWLGHGISQDAGEVQRVWQEGQVQR